MNVLIVGAGPTGLMAALEFARKGIFAEIVDAKECPSPLSRAVGILPASMQRLKASGASEQILKEGVYFKNIRIQKGNSMLIDIDASEILSAEDLPISLPQDRTEAIMSAVLKKKGVDVKYNYKVVDIQTDQTEARVTFLDGETKKYDWVIGADGVNSTVREKLGIDFSGYDLSEIWSIADVELNKEYKAESFFGWILDGEEKDIVVMVPIGARRVRVISSTPDSMAALPIKLDIKNIRRMGTFKISVRQAADYVKGRVLLAGDAAHTHSPVGGRGMNLGIDDACEAVEAIIEGKIDQYNILRRKKGARTIRGTEIIRKALVSNNPIEKILVNVIGYSVRSLGFIRKIFLQRVGRL